ncbi:MAG: hypothetical protein RLZ12_1004 [Bacillota bacterium]|jgi:peroxiredoxin (alkyl hydroperoxide reductase subunit C)
MNNISSNLVGREAPAFTLPSTKNLAELDQSVSLTDYKGSWLVLFFYPRDFTFVCPTEIQSLAAHYSKLQELEVDVLGVSTDSTFTHRAWIQAPKATGGLGELPFVLGADSTHKMSKNYGVFIPEEGCSQRALFIIDPEQKVRYQLVNDLQVGFNVQEIIRVISALQTGALCPANWNPGEKTL